MWSVKLLLSLLLAPLWAQQAPQIPAPPQEQVLEPPPPNCGLTTKFAGHKIGDGCLQEALNVIFDKDVGVQRRQGYAQFNTTALTGAAAVRRLYPFDAPDGTQYVIAVSSDKIYSASVGGSFSAITGMTGLSQTENTACVQGLGRLWCTNQSNGLLYWNGTSTGAIAAGPAGSLIDIYRNRVLVSRVSGNQSSLYGSGHLDGENWTTAAASTSPFIIRIGGTNDGDSIQCLMGTYNDAYLIGTESRLYALYGFDNTDFAVREISREVGCIDDTSVQEMDGSLYWLSRRGIERMQGTVVDWKVSYPIINLVEPIIQASGNSQSALDTAQADFEAGNLIVSGQRAAMSATILSGSVVPSSWSVSETSGNDWASYTMVNMSTSVVAGSLILGPLVDLTTVNWMNNSDGTVLPANDTPPWASLGSGIVSSAVATGVFTAVVGSPGGLSLSPTTGTFTVGDTAIFHASHSMTNNSAASNLIQYTLKNGQYCSLLRARPTYTELITCTVGTRISSAAINNATYQEYRTVMRGSNVSVYVGSVPTLLFSGNASTEGVYPPVINFVFSMLGGSSGDGNATFTADFLRFQHGVYAASGTITSGIFDTGLSTPTWGGLAVAISSDSQTTATFEVQSSADGSSFESLVSVPIGSNLTAAQRRYLRYKATFSTSVSSKSARVESIDLLARTTGYFISQCRNPGTSITSWGLFQCNSANDGGSFSFAISTAATCHSATRSTATWNAQTNNTAIAVATAAFVAYRSLLDLGSDGDNQPALQDCTINWEAGGNRPEVASGVYDHRYHLFYTTSTQASPVNTDALVLDQFDRWSKWDNIPARSATRYRSDLLIGDGSATGKIYRLYTGNDDNGAAFTSRIRTKDFDLGNWRANKSFGSLWLELSPENDAADDVDMVAKAYVDLLNAYTLGTVNLDEGTGVIAAEVPWPLDTQNSGRYISIEVSNTGTQPWRFYRGALRYYYLRED